MKAREKAIVKYTKKVFHLLEGTRKTKKSLIRALHDELNDCLPENIISYEQIVSEYGDTAHTAAELQSHIEEKERITQQKRKKIFIFCFVIIFIVIAVVLFFLLFDLISHTEVLVTETITVNS